MDWFVFKTGAESFDMLHAYGLARVIAYATGGPVDLRDAGHIYRLSSSGKLRLIFLNQVMSVLLALPSSDELVTISQETNLEDTKFATLDGLLATLFTSPGIRAVSVRDLLNRQRGNDTTVVRGLDKVRKAIARWVSDTEQALQGSTGQIIDALREYDRDDPIPPVFVPKGEHGVGISIPIDATFGYSTRQPFSDGLIAHRTNVALKQPAIAGLLAVFGAAGFLRGQRVAGELVNLYIPCARQITLTPETVLSMLPGVDQSADRALALRWLDFVQHGQSMAAFWQGLAYQTLQTQGTQQSISRARGSLMYTWLDTLKPSTRQRAIQYWLMQLQADRRILPFDADNLLDAVLYRRVDAWITHLGEVARTFYFLTSSLRRPYIVDEIKEITRAMVSSKDQPLSAILEREEGTYRFGCSLRLLGKYNAAVLRDVTEALEAVRSRDALMRVLAHVAQECTLAEAKTKFIIVPNDADLAYLLDDVDRYGAQTIAGLLIILSVLRYPRVEEPPSSEQHSSNGLEPPLG